MHIHRAFAFPAIFAFAILCGPSAPALAQDEVSLPVLSWDDDISRFQFDVDKYVGQRLSLSCPPRSSSNETAQVSGTGIYPSGTPLCPAALHAGVIDTNGGSFTVQLNPGAAQYVGSTQNGVTSEGLPATDRSIAFLTPDDLGLLDEVRAEHLPRLEWDTRFTHTGLANRDLLGQRFTFVCPSAPAPLPVSRVVGTDLYAFATPLCPAARHAGAVSLDGGVIEVQLLPRAKRLQGSTRNGVRSHSGSSGIRTLVFVEPQS